MGGTLANVFKGGNDAVQGTGQSVGELKKIGYGDGDIASMGGGKPSAGVGMARGILRGAGSNFGSALSGGPPMSGGNAMLPSGPSPTPVDPGYFAPSNFGGPSNGATPWDNRRSPIYGGM